MQTELAIPGPRTGSAFPWLGALIGLAAVTLGFVLFSFDSALHVFLALAGVACVGVLLLFPELALALYVVVGDVKGDPRLGALFPVDLTVALGVILVAGIGLNCVRKKRIVAMPPVYFLFLALLFLMVASLSYTPVLDAGIEKLARFLTVTGIVIVAPFFVLTTPEAMRRFLLGFGIAGFAICVYSLGSLGGDERLVTPSSNTIGLGHIACAVIVLIWFGLVVRCSFPKRMFTYALLLVPAVALLGSGSRGPAIALAVVILASLFYWRWLVIDLCCVAAAGLVAFPFLHIPASSIEYLGSLVRSRSATALLSFRGELFDYGWQLLQQHPLAGAGLQGFRYYSPNPGIYNWPHNIFLEIGCELGIPAALIVLAIFVAAVRDALLQLKDRSSPYETLSRVAAALLVVGIINATNTGDINSDRSTWLFVSLVFTVRGYLGKSIAAERPQAVAIRTMPA
jgi:O-antigen ligase